MTITVENLSLDNVAWFVEEACVRMITEELKRPDLVDLNNFYTLAGIGMQSGTGWVAKKDGVNIGALGSLIVPNIFNPKFKTLAEIFWWVNPDHRQSRAGLLLIKAFDKRAQEIADDSTLSLLSSSTVNISSLERRGFELSEFAFRKDYKKWQ